MIISVISSIAVWGCAAILLMRIINFSGISIPQNKVTAFLTADESLSKSGSEADCHTFIMIMLAALGFRLIVFCLSALAVALFNNGDLTFESFVQQYVQWDANNYQRIADLGYAGYVAENGDLTTLVFFPLYPWIARLFNIITGNTYISLLIISVICYCVACGFLYKLVSIDCNNSTAIKAVILISVFPHSLFFGTMMNESLLLLNSVITLYFIRKHNWPLVGIFGALAALSRMAGILLAIPAAVEWLEYYKILEKLKSKQIKDVWKLFYSKGLWIFLILVGIGIYFLCNYVLTGNCFSFLEYQERYWSNGSRYFGAAIADIFHRAFSENSFSRAALWIPETVSILFVITMIIYGMRHNKSMYTAFLIVYFIINTGFKWPISVARYMTCAVPAFIYLAEFADRHEWADKLITVSMAIGFGIYLTAYLFSKQIL